MSYNKMENQINIISSFDTLSRKHRIDPSQYNVETQRIIRNCKTHNIKLIKMLDLNCIQGMYLPNRFSRSYTTSPESGVPMLGTSSMLNMKLPTDSRIFISKINNHKKLYIDAGDILVSRSGTVGTSVLCGDTFVGFVASDHCIRLKVKEELRGYIAAYLRTKYGMALLVKDSHGKVIKELTEENIQDLYVMYFENEVKQINEMMLKATSKYDEARMLLEMVEKKLGEELNSFLPKVLESNNNIVPFYGLLANRIDPHIYNHNSNYIFREIQKGKHRLLGDVVNIWGAPRFKRHYLHKDNQNGVGLFSSSDIVRANFSPSKYISKKLNAKELVKCEIQTDTVLIPCSGTYGGIIGRGVLAGELMNGSVITQHVLRVAKKNNNMSFFYIAAFLCSNNWGYKLITATRFGKDIPEVDPEVLKTIPIPDIAAEVQKEIGEYFKKASTLQEEANILENEAVELLEKRYEYLLINQ